MNIQRNERMNVVKWICENIINIMRAHFAENLFEILFLSLFLLNAFKVTKQFLFILLPLHTTRRLRCYNLRFLFSFFFFRSSFILLSAFYVWKCVHVCCFVFFFFSLSLLLSHLLSCTSKSQMHIQIHTLGWHTAMAKWSKVTNFDYANCAYI